MSGEFLCEMCIRDRDNKINTLPLVDAEGNLKYFVFRKDYDSHKKNVNELLDITASRNRPLIGTRWGIPWA